MSLLGKILLVFNLLAGGGFAYLALQDWKGRQTITAAGQRYLLVLGGIPLEGKEEWDSDDESPFVVEGPGGVPTETISKKFLDTYFSSAAGTGSSNGVVLGGNMPVLTQLAEVKRVRGVVRQAIDAADGPAAKSQLIGGWLLLQAETYEERAAIQALIASNDAVELDKRLSQKFDAVLNPPQKPATDSLAGQADEESRLKAADDLRHSVSADASQRRERVAHLLVHLDRDAAWQKRVMLVVGLKRYVATIGAQTLRFAEMLSRVNRDIEADNAAFAQQYTLLRDQATKYTQMVNGAASNRRKLEEQLTKDQGFVNQRKTQLETIRVQLQKVKGEVDELLANQAKVEKVLFEVQREVGLTLEEVYKLEAELDKKERERIGSP